MRGNLMKGISAVALVAGLEILTGGYSVAYAQDAGDVEAKASSEDSDAVQDVVIVTATGREQAVEDIPYNISTMSGSDLADMNIVDFSKLARTFAGLQLTDRGVRDNTTSARLISRGLNTETSEFADLPFVTASPVATYIDNTPIFVNLRLNDVKRVEFLRGPQGTLYGSGSLGGTLRFIHNNPDPSEFYARIDSGLSTTEDADGANYTVSGVANMPLSDKVAFRISGGYDFYHGFIDGPNRAILGADEIAEPADPSDPLGSAPATRAIKDINDADVTYLHAALRAELNEAWAVQLNYHHQEDSADNRDAQSATPGVPARTTNAYLNEPLSRDLDLFSLDVEGDFGFAKLTSNTSYFETETRAVMDGTGVYDSIGYLLSPRVTAPIDLNSSGETFVQEVRLISQTQGPVEWLVGAFYLNEEQVALDETDWFRGDGLLGNYLTAPNDLFLNLYRETEFQDTALYGELTYWLNDRWQVTGGARLFRQEFKSYSFFDFPAFGFYPGDPNSFDEDGVLFKANTSYEVSETANIYATFSQGFRRGGANSVPTSGPLAEPLGLVSYDSDRVNNYEIGVKGATDDGFHYTAAAYYVDWKDAQIGTLSPVFGYDVAVNGGDAQTLGLELEAGGSITDYLQYSASYAYTDAELDEGFTGYVIGQSGARLPGVSEHTLSGALDFNYPLSNGATLLAHVDGSYRSDFVNSVDNTSDIYREFDGYSIFAASVGLQFDRWRATLYAENIFDEEGISAQNDGVANGPLNYVEWVIRPRTIGISLSREF